MKKIALKKIGLLGGLSPESTVEYYKMINNDVRKVLGGCSSAELIIESFNFKEIVDLQFQGKWDELADMLTEAAQNLVTAGAEYIVICTNLMHKVAPQVQAKIPVPLIHMVDSVAKQIKKQKIDKVGLLGTIFTMEEDFYSKKLMEDYGIETIIPEKEDREEVSRVIYKELCCGIISEDSKQKYLEIIDKMKAEGAQGVILGCTEIPLLITEASIPILNTTQIHAMNVVEKILEDCLAVA